VWDNTSQRMVFTVVLILLFCKVTKNFLAYIFSTFYYIECDRILPVQCENSPTKISFRTSQFLCKTMSQEQTQ